MKDWMDFIVGFWCGVMIAVPLGMMIEKAKAADLDVAATQRQVNAILRTNVKELPTVYIVDSLPKRMWGAYAENEIRISAEAPESCRGLILAHEDAHFVAIRAGLLAKIPSDIDMLKAELERLARIVEHQYRPWSPNCFARTD